MKTAQEKLENMTSTMESQQKLVIFLFIFYLFQVISFFFTKIHDTIGQHMNLKKDYAVKEKEWSDKIAGYQTQIKDKDALLTSLGSQVRFFFNSAPASFF